MCRGIYRPKEHLAWVKGNVTGCKEVPPEMVASIAEAGPGVRGPTAKELIGPRLEAFVNCLIGCPRGIVYHSSIDLSIKIHTGRLICAHLDKIIDEVGPENVVQVVTDNAANYKKASLLLMERRLNLYWTPCASHCINLMLKEIGKLKRVKYCILKSKLITRESTTRFATAFLTIQLILVNDAGLSSMIRSNEWHTDRAAMSQLGRQVETTLLNRRLSDSDDKPTMGFLFDAMRHAREAIFENNIWNEEILEIVDREFFLNPQNLYSNATLNDADIMEGVKNCIYRLEPDLETQMECMQQIAVRILSQTCAASGCERNWSTFQWIHAPRWNRLKTQTLHNLVYVHYNLKFRGKHIRRTPTNYTPINLDYIFWRDLADEWVSLRTPVLNQDFLSGAVADMDGNVNVAASNERNMAMDMDDDYTQDEDEAQDDETDGTMKNNWQDSVIQECEGAQHDVVPDEQEDLMRLAREEVQTWRYRSYSTRERRSRSRHRSLVIHDDDNIEDDEGHNTERVGVT
ncbi:hypothetical protein AMTRI_Chr12g270310 [Amborella trichopoda]